jgi:hypothetical protein
MHEQDIKYQILEGSRRKLPVGQRVVLKLTRYGKDAGKEDKKSPGG